jgi:hypothetical protein
VIGCDTEPRAAGQNDSAKEATALEKRYVELRRFLYKRGEPPPDAPPLGLAFDRYFRERQDEFNTRRHTRR